ncbi:hypothetical protein BU26DRAFT_280405 [Trematosphaeria pertusa]|uniref:Uncharacterized protein n=1 Tax=Trematosphaeria pertusa TaxID=390896 RepID=A0A6A6IL15_9PLEO|nr:uncharacterized protein BU26DRAFT_280405 [Trematosphaeria pertusa]KAF2251304.1 hypothetical protein BU26DRAFT_280405 [Trematosphaeria pertusa]
MWAVMHIQVFPLGLSTHICFLYLTVVPTQIRSFLFRQFQRYTTHLHIPQRTFHPTSPQPPATDHLTFRNPPSPATITLPSPFSTVSYIQHAQSS